MKKFIVYYWKYGKMRTAIEIDSTKEELIKRYEDFAESDVLVIEIPENAEK